MIIPWEVSYGETLTWTRSPLMTLILCFFILPERTPLTMTWLSHSISMVPPPNTRVTVPSSWIKSSRLNGPPSTKHRQWSAGNFALQIIAFRGRSNLRGLWAIPFNNDIGLDKTLLFCHFLHPMSTLRLPRAFAQRMPRIDPEGYRRTGATAWSYGYCVLK